MEPITDPRDVGKFLKAKIKERGLLIKEVADFISADPSYMSHLLSGRVSIVESEYFGPLVKLLNLTVDEVRAINPTAVIEIAPPEPRVSRSASLSAHAMGYRGPKPEREIPEGLKEAARLFGHLPMFEGLGTLRWQWHLSQIPYKHRPTTPEEWAEEFLEVKAKHDPPEVE